MMHERSARNTVTCDSEGCAAAYVEKRWKDPTDLPQYSVRNARRQARKRGWVTLYGHPKASDLCPAHHPPDPGGVDITNVPL